MTLPVLAGPFEDAVAKFANDEFSDTEEAIGTIATSGNPLAYPIINALQEERLMADTGERINTPISTAEMERRWSAVRACMKEHRIDVLLMQANARSAILQADAQLNVPPPAPGPGVARA